MGPTISGLESLLRLPTGCGEQNMLNFAPAVYIAHYLDTIGKLDAATRKKALHYMQTGKTLKARLSALLKSIKDILLY